MYRVLKHINILVDALVSETFQNIVPLIFQVSVSMARTLLQKLTL